MEVVVLGSSADKGFFHRKGKDRRTRSSICVLNKGKSVVIDCGPDFEKQIKREKIKPDYIILTHSHPDHTKGLYKKRIRVPVYATKSTWQDLKKAKVAQSLRKIIKPNRPFKLAGLEILVFEVGHSPRIKTYGLEINSLIYIPDFTKIPSKNKKIVSSAIILVLDGSILDRDLNIHASIKKQLKWAKSWTKPRKIYFTHIGRNTAKRKHPELVKFLKTKDRRADVFYDGLRFKL